MFLFRKLLHKIKDAVLHILYTIYFRNAGFTKNNNKKVDIHQNCVQTNHTMLKLSHIFWYSYYIDWINFNIISWILTNFHEIVVLRNTFRSNTVSPLGNTMERVARWSRSSTLLNGNKRKHNTHKSFDIFYLMWLPTLDWLHDSPPD